MNPELYGEDRSARVACILPSHAWGNRPGRRPISADVSGVASAIAAMIFANGRGSVRIRSVRAMVGWGTTKPEEGASRRPRDAAAPPLESAQVRSRCDHNVQEWWPSDRQTSYAYGDPRVEHGPSAA